MRDPLDILHWHDCDSCKAHIECRSHLCWRSRRVGTYKNAPVLSNADDCYCSRCQNPVSHLLVLINDDLIGTVNGALPGGDGGTVEDAQRTLCGYTGWESYPIFDSVIMLLDDQPCRVCVPLVESDSTPELLAFSPLRTTREPLVWTDGASLMSNPVMVSLHERAQSSFLLSFAIPFRRLLGN